jgi:hypothetical protein
MDLKLRTADGPVLWSGTIARANAAQIILAGVWHFCPDTPQVILLDRMKFERRRVQKSFFGFVVSLVSDETPSILLSRRNCSCAACHVSSSKIRQRAAS